MSDIEAKLADATTDDEARAAIEAAYLSTIESPFDEQPTAGMVKALLDGPSAGWIGVGVLMAADYPYWSIEAETDRSGVYTGRWEAWAGKWADAARPDCALVLANLLRAKAPA